MLSGYHPLGTFLPLRSAPCCTEIITAVFSLDHEVPGLSFLKKTEINSLLSYEIRD